MSEISEAPSGQRRRGIQSVEIGLQVLKVMNALGGPSTLSAIAQAAGMAAPQVHRYLQSLIASEMAQQDAETGRYDLGPAALKLGLSALARTDAFRLVDTLIGSFVARTGATVQVAALGPSGPTIVRWYAGQPAITTSLTVGSILSLLHSATGRVFLAFAPEALTDPVLSAELRRTPMKRVDLDRMCGLIRDEGRAHASGTVMPGLEGFAFPIFNLQGTPVLVATMLVSDAVRTVDHAAVEELAAICQQIGQQLGWPGGE
ncbi:IclR family transcriptional regulator [Sphingomonas sp. BK069]|uniref:IclR family transcriptional regulator n=1 Tax=Sphingomonas sp. BK069 TaxID=2586979 RepID=UPI001619242C|nr:helix-turn-helix domain-containing protein [Sphingomonas sp. BK069]MBB3349518.1 DNA-binding IclR family transcriptional regulator [Sphingomonas sp. BK069]